MTNKKPSKGKIRGYVMAGAGFVMILANALDYLLRLETEFTPSGIIGLVFVVIGMGFVRNEKAKNQL